VLAVISLLSWRKRGHQIILALTLFLYARYLLWRGLYTLNTSDWASLPMSWTVYTAEAYAFVQILLLAYHAWSPPERQPVPLNRYPIVDIFVTVVDEPLSILRRTLIGCVNQDYPNAIRPSKKRPFVITPKGVVQEERRRVSSWGCSLQDS